MDQRTINRLEQADDAVSTGDVARLPEALRLCMRLPQKGPTKGLRKWASLEVDGYSAADDDRDAIPPYRRISAPVYGVNQVGNRTIIPMTAMPDYLQQYFEELRLTMGVETIREFSAQDEALRLTVRIMPEAVQDLNKLGILNWPHTLTSIYFEVNPIQLRSVLHAVLSQLSERLDAIDRPQFERTQTSANPVPQEQTTTVVHGDHAIINQGDNSPVSSKLFAGGSSTRIQRWTLASHWVRVVLAAVAIVVTVYLAYRFAT